MGRRDSMRSTSALLQVLHPQNCNLYVSLLTLLIYRFSQTSILKYLHMFSQFSPLSHVNFIHRYIHMSQRFALTVLNLCAHAAYV